MNPLIMMLMLNSGLPLLSGLFGKIAGVHAVTPAVTPATTPAAGMDANMMQMMMMMMLFSGKDNDSSLPLMMMMMGGGLTGKSPAEGLTDMQATVVQLEEYKKTIDILSAQIELMKKGGK